MNNLFTAFHLSSLFERLVNFRNVFVTQNCSRITHSCRPCVNSSLKIFHVSWPLGSISEALVPAPRLAHPVSFAEPLPCCSAFPTQPSSNPSAGERLPNKARRWRPVWGAEGGTAVECRLLPLRSG